MLESIAVLETVNGSKYLVQLCKHFAHKITVDYCDSHGECQFMRGAAVLDADENGLRMVVRAEDEEGLSQTRSIVETHLLRFAFRENMTALDWQRRDRAA